MKEKIVVGWRFCSDGPRSLEITGTAGGISLVFDVQPAAEYPGPITAAEIVESLRRLEDVLVEAVALNERHKEPR